MISWKVAHLNQPKKTAIERINASIICSFYSFNAAASTSGIWAPTDCGFDLSHKWIISV